MSDDLDLAIQDAHLALIGVPRPLFDELCALLGTDAVELALERVANREIERRAAPVCVDCGEPAEIATPRFVLLCHGCADARDAARAAAPSSPPTWGLQNALSRARRTRVPATLTPEEWNATVVHFANRCAYCGGPWCIVEHATGLRLGGGTTKDNCLPACDECNRIKAGRPIEALRGLSDFDATRLKRAIAWLVSHGRGSPSTKEF